MTNRKFVPAKPLPRVKVELPNNEPPDRYEPDKIFTQLFNSDFEHCRSNSRELDDEIKRVNDVLASTSRETEVYRSKMELLLLAERLHIRRKRDEQTIACTYLDREIGKCKLDRSLREYVLPSGDARVQQHDRFHAQPLGIHDQGFTYEGTVAAVPRRGGLRVTFSQEFDRVYKDNMNMRIEFQLKDGIDFQLRAMSQIGDLTLDHLVWPSVSPSITCDQTMVTRIQHMKRSDYRNQLEEQVNAFLSHDDQTKRNREQLAAILTIASGVYAPCPFVVFGPPGTGKTRTVISAVCHICNENLNTTRILLCAPSNRAVDMLAEALVREGCIAKAQIFRMHSLSRDLDEVSTTVIGISRTAMIPGTKELSFTYPSIKVLEQFKVVLCTVAMTGCLVSAPLRGFFTHIIIDDATRVTEPMCMVPFAGLATTDEDQAKCTRLILVGDPSLLQPNVQSRWARKHLSVSMIQRLLTDTEGIYKRDSDGEFDCRFVANLTCNSRSHPGLVRFISRMLNEARMTSSTDDGGDDSRENDDPTKTWYRLLPNKEIPLTVQLVQGEANKEGCGPSRTNANEVAMVKHYVEMLMAENSYGVGISASEIAILSPFQTQVENIREALRDIRGKDLLTIETVSQFYGEKSVVIFSLVKSEVGGYSDEKILNTVVSRARCSLIIIGHLRVLSYDHVWKRVFDYANEHGLVVREAPTKSAIEVVNRVIMNRATRASPLDERSRPHRPAFYRENATSTT